MGGEAVAVPVRRIDGYELPSSSLSRMKWKASTVRSPNFHVAEAVRLRGNLNSHEFSYPRVETYPAVRS